ncbi:MAG: CarD family transcriptional regulator [Bacillota bacterium]|nr:CarD family transcriptional regulator [Bacillota bacterium]
MLALNGNYKIGDKVVYPMHGAGVIQAIENHEVLGHVQEYYVMRMPVGDLKVMVPVDSAISVGLRGVIEESEVENVIEALKGQRRGMSANWNKRYRANLEKMKTGDIYEVAGVVQGLAYRDREKGLSAGERKMLESARQILFSELVLAKGVDENTVRQIVDDVLEELA